MEDIVLESRFKVLSDQTHEDDVVKDTIMLKAGANDFKSR